MRSFFCFIALTSAISGADIIHCPPTVQVTQRLAAPLPGWSPLSDDTPHQLAGLTFFEGKPSEKASLVPDKQAAGVSTWTFSKSPIWVACAYSSTGILLTRELPKNIRTCSVTYSRRDTIAGLPVVEKVDCK